MKLGTKFGVLLTVLVASTQPFAQPADRPQWQKGDTWTYKVLVLPAAFGSLRTIESAEVFSVREEASDGYDILIQTLDANSQLVSEWRGRNSLNAFPINKSTQDGSWGEAYWPKWPMTPDTQTNFEGKQTDGTGYRKVTSVQGWEEVTVPAGHFRALRINLKFYKGYYFRDEIWWYAPDVKRYVRYEERSRWEHKDTSHTSWELVTYSLH